MLLDRNLLEVRIVELNQQGYEDVLPASIEISVELCQEVPQLSLVVELDTSLVLMLQTISNLTMLDTISMGLYNVQEFEGIKLGMEPLTTRSRWRRSWKLL